MGLKRLYSPVCPLVLNLPYEVQKRRNLANIGVFRLCYKNFQKSVANRSVNYENVLKKSRRVNYFRK